MLRCLAEHGMKPRWYCPPGWIHPGVREWPIMQPSSAPSSPSQVHHLRTFFHITSLYFYVMFTRNMNKCVISTVRKALCCWSCKCETTTNTQTPAQPPWTRRHTQTHAHNHHGHTDTCTTAHRQIRMHIYTRNSYLSSSPSISHHPHFALVWTLSPPIHMWQPRRLQPAHTGEEERVTVARSLMLWYNGVGDTHGTITIRFHSFLCLLLTVQWQSLRICSQVLTHCDD